MKTVTKLLNDLLEAGKLSEQTEATDNLLKGIEDYSNKRVVEALETFKVNFMNTVIKFTKEKNEV